MSRWLFLLLASAFALLFAAAVPADPVEASRTETLVLIRHAEKPPLGLGQLSVRGFNRALALPPLLIGRYGKADYLFAPSTATLIDGSGPKSPGFSYLRPLATIEPTAIMLGLPVNAQIDYRDIARLQSELTKPQYAGSVVFVAWAYTHLSQLARGLVKSYGGDPSVVPAWQANDFDSIFVIRLQRAGKKVTGTFAIEHEGLTGKLSDTYPAPVVP